MSNPEILQFSSVSQLDETLADIVAELLQEAIDTKGRATLVVSGGSTPVGFFTKLSKIALPWAQVWITLADDRWVDPEETSSNEYLVREHLLKNAAKDARFISLNRSHVSVEEAAKRAEEAVRSLGVFDVVVLGMGADGHTASLFPDSHELKFALAMDSGQSCLSLLPPVAPFYRITMTLPRLLKATQIMVQFTGTEKKAVFDQALITGDSKQWPIAAVISQQATPVSVFYAE